MSRICQFLSGCLLALLLGCGEPPNVNQEQETEKPSFPVRTVSTVKEFVEALGSNRVIRLQPGTYKLTGPVGKKVQNVVWENAFDGWQLTLRNITNLTIEGGGSEPSRIINPAVYANVLSFTNADNIRLSNLVLGHSPKPGGCAGGVLYFDSARNVTLERLDLFGCGINGLSATDVIGLTLTDSVIRDCTESLATLRGCSDVKFVNSKRINTKGYTTLGIAASQKVVFDKCTISGNTAGSVDNLGKDWSGIYANFRALFSVEGRSQVQLTDCNITKNTAGILFHVDETSSVTASGCTISGNLAAYLTQTPTSLKLKSTTVEGNTLRKGRFLKP